MGKYYNKKLIDTRKGEETAENLSKILLQTALPQLTPTEILSVEAYISDWAPGDFIAGDVRKHLGQVWECAQGHSNANNPDIEPGKSPAQWFPYHSKSPEYAKPYVPPQGAHDAYQEGEHCIYDGKLYMSKINANTWTPTGYPQGWELVE